MKHKTFVSLTLVFSAATLTGCAIGSSSIVERTTSALNGRVHGGQQPVSGASIQLYAVGGTGYGSSYPYNDGTSLLGSNVVKTDATGSFTLTGLYDCPSPSSTPVYMVARAGNPGLSSGGRTTPPDNPNLALMVALGPCSGLTSSTYIEVNELTTTAAVWALSPFMLSTTQIGSTATNVQGIANAFATADELVDPSSGTVPGPALPANATVPVAELNTIADILAFCVNSPGGVPGDGSACGTLFAALKANITAPADTISAALVMAQNPSLNVASLLSLLPPTAPFLPILANTPNDWTLAVTYQGGGLSAPAGIAADPSGNVWVANAGNSSVTELSALGTVLSPSAGFTAGGISAPSAIAIDSNGEAWVTNTGNNTLTKINPLETAAFQYTGGSLDAPKSIAFDPAGNAWVANYGNSSVSVFSSAGVPLSVNGYSGGGLNAPNSIAVSAH